MSRQKLVGWILIVVSAAYLAWFVRVRLFTAGPAVEKKEWLQAIGSILILMLGTINVRLAAMRARSRDRQAVEPLSEREDGRRTK